MVALRVHSQPTRRVRPARSKKVDSYQYHEAYRSSLTSPAHVAWPTIPPNLQNLVLAQTIGLLERAEVARYHLDRRAASRKKRGHAIAKAANVHVHGATTEATMDPISQPSQSRPPLLRHTIIGINAVTKRLESQSLARRAVISTERTDLSEEPPLAVILVCYADIQPTALVDHLPELVAAYNSTIVLGGQRCSASRLLRLVKFPYLSEDPLAAALGIRRVSVLAFDAEAPDLEQLLSHIETVPVPLFVISSSSRQ